ncbi:hypothetical protein Vafri_11379 [Volvox africanus]|nr:hypothetical protein Vafri_11379 [Volvox africanus]
MSYAFPTNLSADEIQQCLGDLQINLDPSQLVKPTSEGVRIIYEQAVIALMGVTREELMQPNFSALTVFEYPELQDDSIPVINFLQKLSQLMLLSGVRDFNLSDVFKPEPGRLKRNICAIINFAKFRDEKVVMLDELEKSVEEKLRQNQAEVQEYEANLAELRRLKELHATRQTEAAAFESEVQAISASIMQLNKAHTALSEETRAIKAQCNALTDQAAEAKLTLHSLHSEAMELQDQIVQSPEKHKTAINDLLMAVERKRDYFTAMCLAYDEHERKLEMMAKSERELQRCVKLQEDLEVAVARKKDVSTATKDNREAIALEERRYNELVSTHVTTQRQFLSLQDKLSHIKQQGQLKLDAAAALLEEQVKRREAAEAERAVGGARAAEHEAQVRQWRERTEEVRAAKDAKTKAVLDKYNTLRRAVSEYNKRLEAVVSVNLDTDAIVDVATVCAAGLRDAGLSDIAPSLDTGAARGTAILTSGMQHLHLS